MWSNERVCGKCTTAYTKFWIENPLADRQTFVTKAWFLDCTSIVWSQILELSKAGEASKWKQNLIIWFAVVVICMWCGHTCGVACVCMVAGDGEHIEGTDSSLCQSPVLPKFGWEASLGEKDSCHSFQDLPALLYYNKPILWFSIGRGCSDIASIGLQCGHCFFSKEASIKITLDHYQESSCINKWFSTVLLEYLLQRSPECYITPGEGGTLINWDQHIFDSA